MPGTTFAERGYDYDSLATHWTRGHAAIGDAETPAMAARALFPSHYYDDRIGGATDPGTLFEVVIALAEMDKVPPRLGFPVGDLQGHLTRVGDGWLQRYSGCDIYYSVGGGAHEVHGDIRAKYDFLGGATGVLGFPVTDETGTPDRPGRYNHFQGGSIYWTQNTGPMMVHGAIRDRWAALGWERSWLGFPTADEYRLRGAGPADHPRVAWQRFENGAMTEMHGVTDAAIPVEVDNERLRRLLRAMIDDGVHESPDNIGLEAGTEDLGTSDWGWDFYSSVPRQLGVRLHGFHDNGLWPDTDFTVELRLRLGLAWIPSISAYPTVKTLIATLDHIYVRASGAGSQQVADGVKDGIWNAFFRGGPAPGRPEVPDGAVFIAEMPTQVDQHGDGEIFVVDILTTAQGGLQFLTPAGPIVLGGAYDGRRILVQAAVDQALGDG
jgi:hypothetical protein